MEKKKVVRNVMIFATVVVALGIIYGVRHMGLQGVSNLFRPLLSFLEKRPMIVATAVQPMVVWKKVAVASLFKMNQESPPRPTDAVQEEAKPTAVPALVEIVPLEGKSTPSEPVTLAAVAQAAIEPIESDKTAIPNAPVTETPPTLLPYSLQLSSYQSAENARKFVANFKAKGLTAYIVKVELEGDLGTWWRVYTGQYESWEEALAAQKTLGIDDAIVKKTPFANLVGQFASLKETRTEKERLQDLGLSPYVLEDSDSAFRLFVGAYTRKTQAEQHALELQTMGLVSQAVTR